MAKTIRVLKVPKSAFNPDREPSSLLLSQVDQLQKAVRAAIDTEGEAADAIGTLTQLLHRLRPRTTPRSHQETLRSNRKRSTRERKTSSRRTTSRRRARGR
jgi:hypothetical protein